MELNNSSYSWSLYGCNFLLQSPSFKFSRKASSSYSLKLEPPNKQKMKAKRKPLSTPASPSRTREPQCTCMTTEQYARLRAQDPRYKGTSDVASLSTVYLFSRTRAWNYVTEDHPNKHKSQHVEYTEFVRFYENIQVVRHMPAQRNGTIWRLCEHFH